MICLDRIRTDHRVSAMAALDTVELIAARIRNLLAHDRRITMTRRYTYVNNPPEVWVGLTADNGVKVRRDDDHAASCHVLLGRASFGFSAYAYDGNDTEENVWFRYLSHEAVSDDFFERRRNMIRVDITGGRDGDGAGIHDRIVIRDWNCDGVCEERVIAFDTALMRETGEDS